MPGFSDPPNTAVFTCSHVLSGQYPVLFVSHDEPDGDWQFLCNVHEHQTSDFRIVALKQVIGHDESLNDVSDLLPGFVATRTQPSGPWMRQKYEE